MIWLFHERWLRMFKIKSTSFSECRVPVWIWLIYTKSAWCPMVMYLNRYPWLLVRYPLQIPWLFPNAGPSAMQGSIASVGRSAANGKSCSCRMPGSSLRHATVTWCLVNPQGCRHPTWTVPKKWSNFSGQPIMFPGLQHLCQFHAPEMLAVLSRFC